MLKVLLIRHADIDLPRTSRDPSLNAAGRARAQALAHIASMAGVSAIFTSEFERTKQTAAPLAAKLGLQPQIASNALISSLLSGPDDAVTFIVGHSDTVPRMIGEFGFPNPPAIDEPIFDNLFVVAAHVGTRQAAVLHLKYGKEAG